MVIGQTAHGSDGVSTRRPLLLTLIALGSLVCLIGSTGLFAALTDTARTGTNSVDSAGLAGSADIQLATATFDASTGAKTCGTFSENLASGVFTVSDVTPGYQSDYAWFCIKNVGSQPVTISASVDELVDTDTACTGDEALHGDTTCGGDLLGELSSALVVGYYLWDCSTDTFVEGTGGYLKDNATTAAQFADALAVDGTACFSVIMGYPAGNAATDIQKAQTDQATWRFKFTAQA